jgi:hypothetical protein
MAGLNGFDWTYVQDSTAVILLNFCAKNPAFGNTRNVMAHAGNNREILDFVSLEKKRLK